jgi:ABC-type spermidine/putrescine transport system permease subunit I
MQPLLYKPQDFLFPLIISLIVAYPLAYILSKRASGKTTTVIL